MVAIPTLGPILARLSIIEATTRALSGWQVSHPCTVHMSVQPEDVGPLTRPGLFGNWQVIAQCCSLQFAMLLACNLFNFGTICQVFDAFFMQTPAGGLGLVTANERSWDCLYIQYCFTLLPISVWPGK